jgi:hypothetical protein
MAVGVARPILLVRQKALGSDVLDGEVICATARLEGL